MINSIIFSGEEYLHVVCMFLKKPILVNTSFFDLKVTENIDQTEYEDY